MENTPYNAVLGTGTGSSNAPFLQTMLPYSATVPAYHSYGYTASISGCSAACYTAVTSGDTYGVSDGVASGSVNQPNIFSSLGSWQAFCEDYCPRNADHFPALQYANTYQSTNIVFTCTTCSSDTASYSQFISAANAATPSSLLWFTPTDSHNMHDNTIQTGDSYLQTLLVGSGTIASPASGSLLASTLFASGHRTLLMIWWDECGETNGQGYSCDSNNASPNIFYGPHANVTQNFISTATTYDEYSVLRTIEDNFNLSPMTSSTYDNQAPIMSDIFTTNPGSYTLTFQGYDYDGANEETLTLNNQQLVQLPTVDSPQNGGVYVNFTVDMTPLIVPGTNTLVFTHANSDCGVTDTTRNVQITNGVGTVIFSDPTERALDCTHSITYTFNV